MKTSLIAVVAALLAFSIAATAGGGYSSGVVGVGQDAWTQEAFYEPCMNGDVSASGRFSSQLAEDKALVRMGLANAAES